MSKHFEKLNGLLAGMERNTFKNIDNDCPPQFVGIAQFYRGAFLAHVVTADLMREWMNGGDRQEVLHLAGLNNTFVFFEDGIDYEEHDLDRDGKEIPIKAETAFEQFLDLKKSLGEMDFTKAWMMYLGLRDLLGFTEDDISQMWSSPRWKQYGHGVMVTPSLEQVKRIEELEFQAKTAPFRAVIESYDRSGYGHVGFEADEVYSAVQNLLGVYDEKSPESWVQKIELIWCEWDQNFHASDCWDTYIDRIRAVIGMPKPEEEKANE